MESKLEVLVKSATELRNKPSQKLNLCVSIRLRGEDKRDAHMHESRVRMNVYACALHIYN